MIHQRLIHHAVDRYEDCLTGEVRRAETWKITFGDDSVGGVMTVMRAQNENSPIDVPDDVLVVEADADSTDACWTMYWASDPDFPFALTDTQNQRVFETLPDDLCDLVEEITRLSMDEARA